MIELLANAAIEDGAEPTFRRVAQRIREAERTIEIHMFVWRSDEIGNQIGREVLAAANRGVSVTIRKDIGAFMYERIEMNRKSLFDKPVTMRQRAMYKLAALTFPDTFVRDEHDHRVGDALLGHDHISVEWVNHTHTKYYIFDERIMITGSINLEDRHRRYRDYMVELSGAEQVSRFRQRQQGAPIERGRPIEFVLNARGDFEIKREILRLLQEARRTVYIEMAYLGDPDVDAEIIAAARRGAAVTILFSREANVGNDLNYRTLFRLCRAATIEVYLTPKMVHSKMILVDDETALLGSANLSVFSLQKADELDLLIQRQPEFIRALREEAKRRMGLSERLTSTDALKGYNGFVAALQQLHQKLT